MRKLEDAYLHKGLRKQLVDLLRTKGITDEQVLEAIGSIPRHFFLDSAFDRIAYEDRAFPIAANQTISQPYTVAYQTQLLQIKPGEKVLEIGGGNTFIAEQISDRFKNVHITCLDPSYSTITINENIKLISGFFPTDLQNQKFDLIFSFNTLEHIPDSASFLKALNEFLVESGLLVISFPESSKQIANGDWNLFSQQHVNYFIAPFFFDYFEKYDLKIVDYVVQYDEAIVTCRKPSKEQKISQLFGGFDSISSSAEIDLRFLNNFNAISDLLLSNKANLDRFFVHGATAGILNIVSNLRNAEFFWDNLKIIDNDSIKHGKYLSGFRNQVFPLDQVNSQPLSVLIATSTFSNEIKKSWLDRFDSENIKFYLV